MQIADCRNQFGQHTLLELCGIILSLVKSARKQNNGANYWFEQFVVSLLIAMSRYTKYLLLINNCKVACMFHKHR